MNTHKETAETLALELLGRHLHELGLEERRVLERIASRTVLGSDYEERAAVNASFGERLADKVAAVGGSWGFIICFALVLLGWMLINSRWVEALGMPVFDSYPFIFLNLMLSTLAAIQAPVIMMSQNRQAAKDRIAARHDYEVNLRAQLEIIHLHRKLDRIATLMARKSGVSD